MFTNLAILGAPHCGILTEYWLIPFGVIQSGWKIQKIHGTCDRLKKTFENGPGTSHIPNIDSSSCDLILGRSAPDFHIFCYGFKRRSKRGVMPHMLDISWVPWDSSCENLIGSCIQLVSIGPRSNENHHGHAGLGSGDHVKFRGPSPAPFIAQWLGYIRIMFLPHTWGRTHLNVRLPQDFMVLHSQSQKLLR